MNFAQRNRRRNKRAEDARSMIGSSLAASFISLGGGGEGGGGTNGGSFHNNGKPSWRASPSGTARRRNRKPVASSMHEFLMNFRLSRFGKVLSHHQVHTRTAFTNMATLSLVYKGQRVIGPQGGLARREIFF